MKLPLLLIAVILMSSRGQGISQSKSCSTVNGRTICEEQQSTGNSAFSSSVAMSGPSSTYKDVYAGAGNPGGEWASGRQTETGEFPGGCDDDTDDSSYSANNAAFADSVLAVSGFGPYQQGYQQGPQQRYPQGPQQGYQQGPQQEYQQGPQGGYPQEQEGYPQEQQQQQEQQPFNPFQFVNRFMNGGGTFAGPGVAYAGPGVAYAGPGVAYAGGGVFPAPFPFGRR